MEWYADKACVSFQELTRDDDGDPIMSVYTYKQLTIRKKINVLRRACYETPALIEFESLPLKYRDAFEAKYGNPKKLVSPNYYLLERIELDPRAEHFYAEYRKPNGESLQVDKQRERTLNASILNAIDVIMTDRLAMRRALGNKRKGAWMAMSEEVNRLKDGDKWNYHTLPANHRRLKDKLERYKTNGYAEFIHRNEGNSNAAKLTEERQDALLMKLAGDPRNLDNEMIATLYNTVSTTCGWETITAGTVANWKERNVMVVTAGTRGATELRNTKTMQVKRVAPSVPMAYWTTDGWDAELLYQAKQMNKQKHWITTYHNRLTLVVVLDPFNKYPIGYAIGTHENPALIKEAFRNAIKHTKELFGQYYKPLQLQSDNYGRGALKPFYSALTDIYSPAAAHNAKAKTIEPWFGYFNNKYCKLMPNWSGYGVTSRKENQPNMDALQKNKHLWPDQQGCADQLRKFVEMDRALKREEFMIGWGNVAEENKLKMSVSDYLMLFGETTGFTNKLEGQGVGVTLLGEKVWFDCFDLDFRNWGHKDFIIKYDPEDVTKVVAVVNEGSKTQPMEGTKHFILERKHMQPMAVVEQTDEDRAQLKRVRDFNRIAETTIIAEQQKATELVEALFDEHPQLNDTLAKFLITDSRGQHKNQRNMLSGRFDDAEIIDVVPIEVPAAPTTEDYEVMDFDPRCVLKQM
ncbi:MAG: hypothetical protein ACRDDZ_06345 [Marinifilaceae bacterium]